MRLQQITAAFWKTFRPVKPAIPSGGPPSNSCTASDRQPENSGLEEGEPRIHFAKDYVLRMLGHHRHPRPPAPPRYYLVYLWSFLGAFISIAILALPTYLHSFFRVHDIPLFVASFGATAVLIYGSIEAPLAQPRNLVLGHVSSAIWGVILNTVFTAITDDPESLRWLSSSLAVAGSIVIMQILGCVHPPGGATALSAVSGGPQIYNLGFLFIAVPILLGVLVMLGIALIFNNIQRHYPVYWWKKKSPETKVTSDASSTTSVETGERSSESLVHFPEKGLSTGDISHSHDIEGIPDTVTSGTHLASLRAHDNGDTVVHAPYAQASRPCSIGQIRSMWTCSTLPTETDASTPTQLPLPTVTDQSLPTDVPELHRLVQHLLVENRLLSQELETYRRKEEPQEN
ncbi:hypothetical protein IWQ61_000315 [Dispira simplex]|nr:hypothetical protein IWQ61_000315 [Dispira simplex]